MAFLQINEDIPEVVKRFIQTHVERQFEDVRRIMMLESCCNFAITALLVNIVSGMSTVFYDQRGYTGKRFKEVLQKFYPWELEPQTEVSREDAIECLYDVLRNPLVHSLGVPSIKVNQKGEPPEVKVSKPSTKYFGIGRVWMPEDCLERLEQSPTAPGPTLSLARESRREDPARRSAVLGCAYDAEPPLER